MILIIIPFIISQNKGYSMKKVLYEYILKNKKSFIILMIIFLLGLLIGIFTINNLSEDLKLEVDTYIESTVQAIKDEDGINRLNMLWLSIKENVLYILLIWFLGCTLIGGGLIYLAIIYKGFSIRLYSGSFCRGSRSKDWRPSLYNSIFIS